MGHFPNDRPLGVNRNTGKGPGTPALISIRKQINVSKQKPAQRDLRHGKIPNTLSALSAESPRPRATIGIRIDAFNVLNHVNYKTTLASRFTFFGRPNGQIRPPTELSLRFHF